MGFGELPNGWTYLHPKKSGREAWKGQEALHLPPPQILPYASLPFLNCIFYSKSVMVRIVLSWVLWVILASYWTWSGEMWGLPKCGEAWALHLQLVSEMGEYCRNESLTLGSALTLDSIRIEQNCWIPSWCWENWVVAGAGKSNKGGDQKCRVLDILQCMEQVCKRKNCPVCHMGFSRLTNANLFLIIWA